MTPDSSAVFDLAGLIDLLRLGGPVVAVLVAMSVIALAIILLKCWQYASVRVGKRRFIAPALDQWHSGDRQGAIAALTDCDLATTARGEAPSIFGSLTAECSKALA